MTVSREQMLALADRLAAYEERYSGDWSSATPTMTWPDLDAIVAALRAQGGSSELRRTLQRLYNEVEGIWTAFEHGIRQEISNTNYACVREKLADAEAALNAAPLRAPHGNATAIGYTEAEGYAASLRQMAKWVREAQGNEVAPSQRIDIGDVDADELEAAADLITRLRSSNGKEACANHPGCGCKEYCIDGWTFPREESHG